MRVSITRVVFFQALFSIGEFCFVFSGRGRFEKLIKKKKAEGLRRSGTHGKLHNFIKIIAYFVFFSYLYPNYININISFSLTKKKIYISFSNRSKFFSTWHSCGVPLSLPVCFFEDFTKNFLFVNK